MTTRVPSGKKMWTLAKLQAAIKDLPEVVPLFGLVGVTLGVAVYTVRRVYFSTAGEAFPDPHMRRDMERQISYGQEFIPKSVFYNVAQWRKDQRDGSLDVAVWPFSNKAFKYDHSYPTHAAPRTGVAAAGPTPTEY